MLKNIIAIATVAALVAGCSTTTPAERMATNQSNCGGYGFKPGTDAYASCMMQMDLENKADDQRRRIAIAGALQKLGSSMQRPRSVTCNTFGNVRRTGAGSYGNATTTCY